jgi:hypothetical protein
VIRTLEGRFADAAPLIGAAVISTCSTGASRASPTPRASSAPSTTAWPTPSRSASRPRCSRYRWALELVPRAGWPAAFLFLACGVLRLARFNVQHNVVDSRYFVGAADPGRGRAARGGRLRHAGAALEALGSERDGGARRHARLPDGQHLPLSAPSRASISGAGAATSACWE